MTAPSNDPAKLPATNNRGFGTLGNIALVVVFVVGALYWAARNPDTLKHWFGPNSEPTTDWQGSLLINVTRINNLNVLRVTNNQIIKANVPGKGLWPDSHTLASVPATTEFYVDLSKAKLSWDTSNRELNVVVPEPRAGEANIFPERVLIYEIGCDTSTVEQRQIATKVSVERARAEFSKQSHSEFYIEQARDAARAALEPILSSMLTSALPQSSEKASVNLPEPKIVINFAKPVLKR